MSRTSSSCSRVTTVMGGSSRVNLGPMSTLSLSSPAPPQPAELPAAQDTWHHVIIIMCLIAIKHC